MTDKPAPKAHAKKGKDKAPKQPGPRLVGKDVRPSIGHNSGQVIPELVKLVGELLAIGEQKKALGKAERDLRNKAKVEFGVLSGPLAHEMRLRKMDGDVRVQFESSHADLKRSLGYQPELDFQAGTPTQASVKAQPPESELAKTPATVGPTPQQDASQQPAGEPEAPADNLEPPAFLRRAAGGVINREG